MNDIQKQELFDNMLEFVSEISNIRLEFVRNNRIDELVSDAKNIIDRINEIEHPVITSEEEAING